MNKNNIVKSLNPILKTALLGAVISATGCEAPLNLEGVTKEHTKSLLRTDQYQAIASTQTTEIVVGNFGVILTRAVGEQSWQRQALEGNPGLLDITVCPDESILVLSFNKQIWRSQDQAKTWTKLALDTPENLLSLTCTPDGSYWAVGSFATLLSSSDQGASWQETSLNEDAQLTSIQFLDAEHGFAAGEFGMLARTNDGGLSWDVLPPMQDEFYPQDTLFLNQLQGWSVGLDGTILHTEDGGESWVISPTPVSAPLFELFTAGGTTYALGENATVLQYIDDSWQTVAVSLPPVYLSAGIATAEGVLLGGGKGTLVALKL
ncbi:WD40/YVTN/BNR-like repeat-containing protein [Pontibacter sp. JAM-7]|uniref:WD40/YVTN/BNR-like repeat-containing protein n=1 Tax=Pontibacter sp. JAM-7 TaxID=3366581 RepID=UPI003AF4203B